MADRRRRGTLRSEDRQRLSAMSLAPASVAAPSSDVAASSALVTAQYERRGRELWGLLAALLPNATTSVLEGQGHGAPTEMLAPILESFFSG